MDDFSTDFIVRAKREAHSGALRAAGVVLALRRLSRTIRNHNHRGSFVADAHAVMGALQKGRSFAGTLRH